MHSACNNQVTADLAVQDETRVQSDRQHVDLIRAVRSIKAELPVDVHFEHICGHQDDRSSLADIPHLGQLNVIVDSMAKEHLDLLIAQRHSPEGLAPCNDNLEGEGWTIHLEGVKLTGDPTLPIRRHVLGEPLQAHMAKKGILCQEAFSHVDWQSTECTMQELVPLHHLWAAKHVHGWCAVGK